MSKKFSLYESDGFWAILENEINDSTNSIKSYCGAELIINRMNELDKQITELKAENERLKMEVSFEKEKKDNALKFIGELQQQLKDNTKQIYDKIIEFINENAWEDVKYDAYQSTMGEFVGSRSAVPKYAAKYFDLWKEMFNEDLYQIEKGGAE